jgi:hypothetical protein
MFSANTNKLKTLFNCFHKDGTVNLE